MLQSMTGFGEAHCQKDGLAVTVEIRAINNRYFKLSIRAPEGYSVLEPLVEGEVRGAIQRGTIQVNIRIDRKHSPDEYAINAAVLTRYRQQLSELMRRWTLGEVSSPSVESMLLLPGVIDDSFAARVDAMADWPLIQNTLQAALVNLGQMRAKEGHAMAADLTENCRIVAACLDVVEQRAPLVVDAYRTKLLERLQRTLTQLNVVLEPADVIKEVGLFTDRSDISEEIVRLRSHLEQFQAIMTSGESAGRKLDFLTQEMFREANTIGSKGNDVEIAKQVIEIKTAIERIREMIQNIE